MSKKKTSKGDFIPCSIKALPADQHIEAAEVARQINPGNTPLLDALIRFLEQLRRRRVKVDEPQAIAVLTSKYWGAKGVKLGVAFLDNAPADLRARVLTHFHAWYDEGRSNVQFFEASRSLAEVRISRGPGGHWSYLGTDVKLVPVHQQTMNLQGFSMSMPESEFRRVIRHEVGHTLGFPHEHLRQEIVSQLNYQKTVTYFRQTQGWSEQEVVANVLTPLEESAIMGTPGADEVSIMTYALPGSITKDGQPIQGGSDINQSDHDFCAKIYPGTAPPEPPPEPPTAPRVRVVVLPEQKMVRYPADWTDTPWTAQEVQAIEKLAAQIGKK